MRFKEELIKILIFLFFSTFSCYVFSAEPVMGGGDNKELKQEVLAENLKLEEQRETQKENAQRIPASIDTSGQKKEPKK